MLHIKYDPKTQQHKIMNTSYSHQCLLVRNLGVTWLRGGFWLRVTYESLDRTVAMARWILTGGLIPYHL